MFFLKKKMASFTGNLLMLTSATKEGISTKEYRFYGEDHPFYKSPYRNYVSMEDISFEEGKTFAFFPFKEEVVFFFLNEDEDVIVFANKTNMMEGYKDLHPMLFTFAFRRGGKILVSALTKVMHDARNSFSKNTKEKELASYKATQEADKKKRLLNSQEANLTEQELLDKIAEAQKAYELALAAKLKADEEAAKQKAEKEAAKRKAEKEAKRLSLLEELENIQLKTEELTKHCQPSFSSVLAGDFGDPSSVVEEDEDNRFELPEGKRWGDDL